MDKKKVAMALDVLDEIFWKAATWVLYAVVIYKFVFWMLG